MFLGRVCKQSGDAVDPQSRQFSFADPLQFRESAFSLSLLSVRVPTAHAFFETLLIDVFAGA